MNNDVAYPDSPPESYRDSVTGAGMGPGSRLWSNRLEPARQRPGEWFRIPGEHSPVIASHIKRGVTGGVEPGEFETTTRVGSSENKRRIWVRYMGATQ